MKVTWKQFAAINADTTDSFQSLASYIYCRQIGTKFKNAPKNYPGLEAKPNKGKDGLVYGYQAKYFDVQDAKSQKAQLIKTLKAVKATDLSALNVLKIYVNETAAGVQDDVETAWNKLVTDSGKTAKVPIEWLCGVNSFQVELESDKSYGHVTAMFFNSGDPIKVHQDNVPEQTIQDLFAKPYFIDLPLSDKKGEITLKNLVKDKKSKVILIRARAGAGKSILLKRFAYIAAGLDRDYQKQQELLVKDGLYIRLNAHEFINSSPRDLISRRLDTYGIDINDYSLRLLIDSLDEISERDARVISQSLQHLMSTGAVQQIISCSREASKNAVIFSQILTPRDVHIDRLDQKILVEYFQNRKNRTKTKLLKDAIKNGTDIELLKDVRMLELAWHVVKFKSDFEKSTLMQKRFESEAENARLEELNLLQPHTDKIETILEEQGYLLQMRESYDFPLALLQRIIEKQNPKLNYGDINKTVGKLKDICIDDIAGFANVMQFEHRSWADYFAARYLSKRFHRKKDILVQFAQYEDFLKEWFVPVTRHRYLMRDNFVGCISIGIIESYLDGYLDRSDVNDELLIKIAISKHHAELREQVEAELQSKIDGGYVTPSFALTCLNAGYDALALKVHNLVLRGLDAKDKDIYQTVWDQLHEFYTLQIHYGRQSKEEILERTQKIIYNDLRGKRGHTSDIERLGDKLASILSTLFDNGLDLGYIIDHSRKTLHYPLFDFFTQPNIAAEISASETLRAKILDFYKGNTEDKLAIQGIFGKDFTQKQKDLTKKLMKIMREETWRRESLSYHYQTKIYALKRILGYCEWEAQPYEHDYSDILTSENIFEHTFYFTIISFDPDKASALAKWLKEAPSYNRSMSARYDNPIKRATTILVAYLLKKLPYTGAQKLLNNVRETENQIISPYFLAIRVHSDDEKRFRGLFSYNDIFTLIDASKESLEEYLSSISDLGGMLAMFEPDKAMTLLYELKRETRLRYGYHKDILGFFLTDALEIMWENNLYNYNELVEKTKSIYELIIGIKKITDGDEVGWLPDYFFEALVRFDMKLAEELYKKYEEDESYDLNIVTIMLLARIDRGDDYDEIKKALTRYQPYYIEHNRVIESYYEHRFIAQMEVVLQEGKYSKEDRTDAIVGASKEIIALVKQQEERWKYHPRDDDKKLTKAIKAYRKYKKILNQETLPPFPRTQKSTNYVGSEEYQAKQITSLETTKKLLEAASSQKEIKDLLGALTYKVRIDVDSGYLLGNEPSAKVFISKLYKFGVNFSDLEEVVERAVQPFYYGRKSQMFTQLLWNSPYREDLRSYLMRSKHHASVSNILRMLINESEFETSRNLIDEVLDCIRLLVRSNRKKP